MSDKSEANSDKTIEELYEILEEKTLKCESDHADLNDLIKLINRRLIDERKGNVRMLNMMQKYPKIESDIVEFNVGGRIF